MSLVITGAAGQLGRLTAQQVADRAHPGSVVLVSRRPDQLDEFAARGFTTRFGDFDDPSSLSAAFAGGERLLLISTDAVGQRVPQHRNALEAARKAGVQAIAYTSIPNATPSNPALVVDDHRQTEDLIRDSGLEWTFLRNALYSEFKINEAKTALASGTYLHNQGDGVSAYVSREDCAAVAAAWLTGGPEHAGRAYDVTGPELLSAAQLARTFAQIGGRPVEADGLDDEEFASRLEAADLPAHVARLLTSFGSAIRGGHLDQRSDVVSDLTGRTPRALAEVVTAAA